MENEIFESRAHLHRLCHPPQQLDCMDVVYIEYDRFNYLSNSGFPSRINLSPFTKDFRGGEQLNESIS